MSLPAASTTIESRESSSTADVRTYLLLTKSAYVFAGIINPLVCFVCAAPAGNWLADTPWQSGEWWVYATLMLKWPEVFPFYPLLIYSMICLGLLIRNSQKWRQYAFVRMGVYGGLVLSLAFGGLVFGDAGRLDKAIVQTVASFVIIGFGSLTLIGAMALAIAIAYAILRRVALNIGGWWKLTLSTAILAVTVVALIAVSNSGDLLDVAGAVLAAPLLLSLAAGPTWSLIAYGCASVQLLNCREHQWRWRIQDVLLLTTWTASLFAAWRLAMDLAIAEYATLPTENPNCFVCTAAARGHAALVGSEEILVNGRKVRVTRQLRVFKSAEIAFKACAPDLHARFRRLYNWLGPVIARRLTNAWIADAVFLALTPLEWLARLMLRIVCGLKRPQIEQLYLRKR